MPEFGEEEPWYDDDEDFEDELMVDAEADFADEIERRGCIRPQAVM